MEQLVCSDQAARCFLVIIHASHQILLLWSKETKTCAWNHVFHCRLCIYVPSVPHWGNSKNKTHSLKYQCLGYK
jgi:hypothetical protein